MFEKIFGKAKKDNNVKAEIKEKYLKLFSLFGECDGTSDAEYLINRMFEGPREYYKKNKFRYDERGITEDVNLDDLVWIEFVDILEECAIVSEIDYKCDLDYFLFSIDRVNNKGIFELKEESFDPDGQVTDWIQILQKQEQIGDNCIAEIDIDSDCYVLFITDNATLKEMHEVALELDRYIRKSIS